MAEKVAYAHSWLMERRPFTLIIVVFFVILSTITFLLCYRHHTIDTEKTLKEDRSTVNLLSLTLEENLKKLVNVMESYTQRPLLLQAVRDKSVEKAVRHLINLKKNYPDVDILIITDKSGTLWAAYPDRPESIGMNLAYREWYKGVSTEWKPNISDVVLRIVREKDLAFQVSVPFVNEKGEVIGILVNTQRTAGLKRIFEQVPLDPGETISVTDRKGQIVFSSRDYVETEIRPYPFHSGIKKAPAAMTNTFAVDDRDPGGRARYISFSQVGDIGWTVFVERDKKSILLSESSYYFQVTAIAFLLFLTLFLFLANSRKQVTAQQIKEQLQAEKKIHASKEKLHALSSRQQALLAAIPDIIMEVGADKIYTWANHSGFDFFGEDVIGKEAAFYFEGEQETYRIVQPLFNGSDELIYLESWQRRKDGEKRLLAWRCRVLKDESGQLTGVLSSARDITDQEQAEKQVLRQSKVLAAINRVFYETLTASSTEEVAKICLKAAQELTDSKFGFIGETTPEGLYTTTALSDPGWEACRIPETQALALMKNMVIRGIWGQVLLKEQSLIVNDPGSYPDRVGIPEGHPPLTSFLGVPLMDQRKVIGMIAMANRESGYTADHQQDMEALSVAFVEAIRRKKAEKEVMRLNVELEQRVMDRTAQLSAANKELEAFSYSVSHDLRAPLRSIDGFSQALLEEYQEKPLDAVGKTFLERVRTATQRMGKLIDNMLKLSRMTQVEMKRGGVDLSGMIREIAEAHQKSHPNRAVDVTIQEGIIVQGDHYLLRIAMENLLDNAFKFTSKAGHPRIEFDTTVKEGKTVCFIRDNGAGFDMAYAGKLFGAFQRLHTKEEFAGTGIGLATVQRIINRHGGRVWPEGEVGKGATFYFTLPL